MKPYEQKIEALLMYKNEPTSYTWLAKMLEMKKEEIKAVISDMQVHYQNRGLMLVVSDEYVSLMTSSIAADIIGDLNKSQKEKELSKQALETLAIVMYKTQVTKSEIDYIRGVNSVFILRNLLIRGLIAKKPNLLDKRSPFYVPTHDTLSHLGIAEVKDMPGFNEIKKNLYTIEDEYREEQAESEPMVVGSADPVVE
ncbi:MAG: segregation and condensation protein B [Candidatus Paceibacteria bacterium]|jgi:segregation and condensation protein B